MQVRITLTIGAALVQDCRQLITIEDGAGRRETTTHRHLGMLHLLQESFEGAALCTINKSMKTLPCRPSFHDATLHSISFDRDGNLVLGAVTEDGKTRVSLEVAATAAPQMLAWGLVMPSIIFDIAVWETHEPIDALERLVGSTLGNNERLVKEKDSADWVLIVSCSYRDPLFVFGKGSTHQIRVLEPRNV